MVSILLAAADPPVSERNTRHRAPHQTALEQKRICWAPVRRQPPKQKRILLGASAVAALGHPHRTARHLPPGGPPRVARPCIPTRFGPAAGPPPDAPAGGAPDAIDGGGHAVAAPPARADGVPPDGRARGAGGGTARPAGARASVGRPYGAERRAVARAHAGGPPVPVRSASTRQRAGVCCAAVLPAALAVCGGAGRARPPRQAVRSGCQGGGCHGGGSRKRLERVAGRRPASGGSSGPCAPGEAAGVDVAAGGGGGGARGRGRRWRRVADRLPIVSSDGPRRVRPGDGTCRGHGPVGAAAALSPATVATATRAPMVGAPRRRCGGWRAVPPAPPPRRRWTMRGGR
ncbi:hypothetical protein BU14_0138s0007 [Porphyra umbilicalis]|uniref:Uncharacterized protein n=1 Tax=Porphyra umbilicalis TaxID=2786 RepID=A0A1X6P9T9_PORUM|nr:hypothetical protein BU14_0138s0007 [Porphyra umbilicalis]|eukprot:OSX77661.1 hypothetical protein BU14_0138s0007 [Porphyra umbilicalis]